MRGGFAVVVWIVAMAVDLCTGMAQLAQAYALPRGETGLRRCAYMFNKDIEALDKRETNGPRMAKKEAQLEVVYSTVTNVPNIFCLRLTMMMMLPRRILPGGVAVRSVTTTVTRTRTHSLSLMQGTPSHGHGYHQLRH